MNIQQLEYIVAVDDHRHFAKAAKHCKVTQPTLSTMIQKVEEELGVKLFNRSRHPIEPTEIGKEVIRQARVSLQSFDKIHQIVADEQSTISGTFLLCIIPTIAPYLLPELISKQYTQYPDLELLIREKTTDQILTRLKDGYIDGAILAGPIKDDDLVAYPIYYEEFYAYVSPYDELYGEREVDLKKIDVDKVWLLENVHCMRGQIERICKSRNVKRHKTIQFESGSIDTLLNIVDLNPGMTIIPEMHAMALSEDKQDRLRKFKGTKVVREVCFVANKHNAKTRMQDVIMDIIKDSVPKSMQSSQLRDFVVPL